MIYRAEVIDENFAAKVLVSLCDCLTVVHAKNIIHRDLKPSNIMLTAAPIPSCLAREAMRRPPDPSQRFQPVAESREVFAPPSIALPPLTLPEIPSPLQPATPAQPVEQSSGTVELKLYLNCELTGKEHKKSKTLRADGRGFFRVEAVKTFRTR